MFGCSLDDMVDGVKGRLSSIWSTVWSLKNIIFKKELTNMLFFVVSKLLHFIDI